MKKIILLLIASMASSMVFGAEISSIKACNSQEPVDLVELIGCPLYFMITPEARKMIEDGTQVPKIYLNTFNYGTYFDINQNELGQLIIDDTPKLLIESSSVETLRVQAKERVIPLELRVLTGAYAPSVTTCSSKGILLTLLRTMKGGLWIQACEMIHEK